MYIIVLQTLNWVGKEYKTSIAKMAIDYNSVESAKAQVWYNLVFLPISQNSPYPNASPS